MYIKPTKSFKINRQTKRLMASIGNKIERDDFKNTMIQAQLFGAQLFVKKSKESKDE